MHAYLILAHHNFEQLTKLLALLDDEHNDIYLHIDKKVKTIPFVELTASIKKAQLYYTERVCVSWAGYSQVEATLLLLRHATFVPHEYYHLISGDDLPLKSQTDIYNFFTQNQGKNFINVGANDRERKEFRQRISKFYWFQDIVGRDYSFMKRTLRKLDRFSCRVQSKLGIDRIKNVDITFYQGSQWFSITDAFARYILEKASFIKKHYKCTFCPDESFVATLLMNSAFKDTLSPQKIRKIDWIRGNPYVFRCADYDALIQSNYLFARKFDETVDNRIILRIFDSIITQQTV